MRDEARFLPECLASLVGFDEVVVCDTGSGDETVAIAAAAGARVVHHVWADDFSAARNAALGACSSRFVLIIDADERLAPGGLRALRRAAADPGVDCGLVPLHNASDPDAPVQAVLAGTARLGESMLAPRLLRRTPDLAYVGRVHEDVGPWLRARLDRVKLVQAPLVHLGGEPALRAALGKAERNLRLLRMDVAERPGDAYRLGHLARSLLIAGELDEAEAIAEQGWTAAEADPTVPCGWLAAVRGMCRHARGDTDGALAAVQAAWLRGSELVDLDLIASEALRQRVAFAESSASAFEAAVHAERLAQRARSRAGRPQLEEASFGATGMVALAARANALLVLGRVEAARVVIGEAAALGLPEGAVAYLRAEAAILGGDFAEAKQRCDDLSSDAPDTWALRAALLSAQGEAQMAAQAADEAWALREAGWEMSHRALWVPALRAAATSDLAPIFVVGADRSGTTLLRAMLDAHPNIAIGPETGLIALACETRDRAKAAAGLHAAAGVPEALVDRATRAYLDALLRGLARGRPRVGEKTPANIYHVHLLARLFPRARFLHIVRDGRDVVASLLQQAWRDGAGELLPHCRDAASAAAYWKTTVAWGRFGLARAPGRGLTVRYEALVANPEAEMKRVLRFLGEPWRASVLSPAAAGVALPAHEASSGAVANPVNASAVGRWRRDLPEPDWTAVTAALGEPLIELGYDTLTPETPPCVA